MKFKDLFIDGFTVNWKRANEIKEFLAMISCQQSTVWHKEGNVSNHTALVCSKMEDYLSTHKMSSRDKLILMAAALCHDLGKPSTTVWDKKENNWKTKCHGSVGEKITRSLFQEEDLQIREEVCALVRRHMDLHHIFDAENPELHQKKIIELSMAGSTVEKFNILNMCDSSGSINDMETEEKIMSRFNRVQKLAEDNQCYTSPYPFKTLRAKFEFKHGFKLNILSDEVPYESQSTVYVMLGLPGAGKNYWIEHNLPSVVTLSRDDIRTEIGIKGDKPMGDRSQEDKVTNILNKRYLRAVQDGLDVVINNTNTLKKWREVLLEKVMEMPNPPKFVYVYVDAPLSLCIDRRNGLMPVDVIDRMERQFEFPDQFEYDELRMVRGYPKESFIKRLLNKIKKH